jgi:excisionase family DNA binding protein
VLRVPVRYCALKANAQWLGGMALSRLREHHRQGTPSASVRRGCQDSSKDSGEDPHMDRKTISIRTACELVGVSRRTIYNWMASSKIDYVRTAGGSVRIFADTLWRDPNSGRQPVAVAALSEKTDGAH